MKKLLILKYQFKNNWKTLVRQLITQRVPLVQKDLFQIAKKNNNNSSEEWAKVTDGKGNTNDYMEKDDQFYSSLDKDNPISRLIDKD